MLGSCVEQHHILTPNCMPEENPMMMLQNVIDIKIILLQSVDYMLHDR